MLFAQNFDRDDVSDASASAHEVVKFSPADDETVTRIFGENMFTRPSYLRSIGHGDLIVSADAGLVPALWSDQKSHLVYLDALRTLTRSEIRRRSALLFDKTSADFLVFEDVRIEDGVEGSVVCGQEFRYKANWRRDLSCGPPFMSGKQANALRRKLKKLTALFGASEPQFDFRRTRRGDVAAIVALNRAKIEREGGRYQMNGDKQSALEILCADIGYTATLSSNGNMLAGNIVCVAGNRSFFPLLGHVLAYQKFSPGSQVTAMALEELARMGCIEANFLWGDSRWKADFKAEREELVTIVVRRNNRVMLTRDYLRVVFPHAVAAAKASLKPHVKPFLDGLGANILRRILVKR